MNEWLALTARHENDGDSWSICDLVCLERSEKVVIMVSLKLPFMNLLLDNLALHRTQTVYHVLQYNQAAGEA